MFLKIHKSGVAFGMDNKGANLLKDTLTCCAIENTNNPNHPEFGPAYGRGIINGIVSAFMAIGLTFEEAIAQIIPLLPQKSDTHGEFDTRCIPDSWKNEFQKHKEIP